RATARQARAAGEWIGGIARRVRDVLRGGLVLRRQPARSEQRERLLEQRRRRAVAGAAAVAERGELDARELVERLAVAVRVEQRLGPTNELHWRDRLAGTELPLPRAGRVGRGRERMVQPGGAPVRARLVPGARGKLRVAGQQVPAGEVASHLAAEDRPQPVLA